MPDTLTITDDRTGNTYQIPIEHGTIRAMDLRQIKTDENDFGLMSYDPGYINTASTKSTITYIDGARGILRYRGYPIEQLAKESTFLEVAFLILFGELPNREELDSWEHDITHQTYLHEKLKSLMQSFCHDAHPMSIFIASVATLATFSTGARSVDDPERRLEQVKSLIAKVPTIAAFSFRHLRGLPYVYPDTDLSYSGNFLNMMFKMSEAKYKPEPALERALDVLFILHAEEIGHVDHVPAHIKQVKTGESRLMGFGHRVYKNYDPRASIIKEIADQVFEVTGRNPLLDIALELERIALEDEYFVSRKLYPNVDFYSGLIYQAMGLPVEMFPVLFAIGRSVGWLAQWGELLTDPEQRIARPRQIYLGADQRDYTPIDKR